MSNPETTPQTRQLYAVQSLDAEVVKRLADERVE